MPVGKQLEILIHELRLSQTEFANQTGLSKQTVNNIISERHVTKTDVLEKISGRYPDINMNWLMNGVGNIWMSGGATVKGRTKVTEAVPMECKNCAHLIKEIEYLKQIIMVKDELIDSQKKMITKLNF